MGLKYCLMTITLLLTSTVSVFAADGTIDTGDTAWIIMSTALVMMMTPAGLALFYGGMSRYKKWIHRMGALDFAGGNVVHINAGVSGLVLALVLGKRNGFGKEPMIPSSVAFTALGAALLWFGWFGFNAGSELAADGVAASAFLVTNTAAALAGLTWLCLEWKISGKPTLLGMASGVIAGLVAITPAAGFVTLSGSLIIGLVSGAVGFYGVVFLKKKLGYDDSLDAFGIHGLCGMWGALATGLFAAPSVTEGARGLFYGNPGQVWIQVVSIIATIAFSAVATLIVVYVTKLICGGLRVDGQDERTGLDSALHGERGFEIE
jgi:Amt family ammonium transporter